MRLTDSYASAVTRYSRVVVVVMLVATAVVGAGAGDVPPGLTISGFASDSEEAEKLDYVTANFETEGENATVVQVVVRGENVLSKPVLVETLRFQRALADNATVGPTLRERGSVSVANLVATAAIQRERAERGEPPLERPPSLDEQIAQLESMSGAAVERTVAAALDPGRERPPGENPYALLSTSYDAGSTEATGMVVVVTQRTDGGGDLSDPVVEGQLATRELAAEEIDGAETFAFGAGIVDEEAGRATGESFQVVAPAMALVVLGVLLFAYRDPLDVALALVGVVAVLLWMGGFMGWAGIGVSQIIIAVPFLLIGLSVDYALHVVMRYREARTDDPDAAPDAAMRRGLGGVVVALGATTFTTAVGFLANLVSPIGSIREFALVSAAGIVAAFLVFALWLPAVKLELERLAERVGLDRDRRAFGRAGAANRVLRAGTVAARRAPVAIVAVGLLVAAGGGAAATDIDTSIDQVDFLPGETPAWQQSLPDPFAPSDYAIKENAVYLNDNFAQSSDRARVEILLEGSVTDPGTLDSVVEGRRAVADGDTAVVLADGDPAVRDPLTVVNRTAADNETVAAVVEDADTDGDGVPDRNLAGVYDAVFAADPDAAAAVLYREDGEYRAARMTVTTRGGADTAAVTAEMRGVAATVAGDSDLAVTATGAPIIDEIVQSGLLRTLVEGFAVTLAVILAFLTAIFYRRYGTLTLGAVTLVPVLYALAWILGTMYLLGIPFSTETAVITSIAIGLGVDYAIHVSERFLEERADAESPAAALDRTVAGTGGALLASAATTASGFGVLMLALVPSLQRFGTVTALAIAYAFVASVVVLPSLLVLWERAGGGAGAAAGGD
jgi:predicted RND superfamily exporter protein